MDVCPQTALEIFGTEMSTDEICEILLKDKKFYDELEELRIFFEKSYERVAR